MFAGFRAYLSLVLLIAVLSLGNVFPGKALAGDAFSPKVEAFRAELSGYQGPLRPQEGYDAGKRINAALLAVLREEESLKATPGDILGDDGRFALDFGNWAGAGERQYRLVVLRPNEMDTGAMASVFSQTRRGDRAISAERVHTLSQGANTGAIVFSGIVGSGSSLLLVIAEKHYGPEDKYVSVYTRKLEKGKWQEYLNPPKLKAKGQWTVRTGDGSFSISHAAVGGKSGNDLEVRACRGGIEILAVDKADMPFDNTWIGLAEGAWVIK
ncbi:MAG: hypothetical protein RIN56_09920 [Sporomusaceae bacterium]|nr:hypothetical protein [Sporomusaceae bacterium]